jgi:hypothetical protein
VTSLGTASSVVLVIVRKFSRILFDGDMQCLGSFMCVAVGISGIYSSAIASIFIWTDVNNSPERLAAAARLA